LARLNPQPVHPYCGSGDETAEHLLLLCLKWAAERQRYFGDSIDITDVFEDYESLVEFLIICPPPQAVPDWLIMTTTTSQLRSQSSAVQTSTDPVTLHLETLINCTLMYATWWGRWELSQHQQPVVRCVGDQGMPECTVQQWLVAGKTNSRVSYYQTDCSGSQAMRRVATLALHMVLH